MVACITRKIVSMKGTGIMIFVMVKVTNDMLMEINMKGINFYLKKNIVNLCKEKLMVKESILGPMVKFTMVNGKQESKKVMEFGKEYLEIHT